MSDRKDFFFRQKVTEAELDAAFSNAEVADRFIASDLGFVGVAAGLVVAQQVSANLTVQVTGPGVAYDQTGQRVSIPSTQNLNCAVDEDSLTTAVVTGGNSRILSIFIEFDRTLSDPRIDGNSNTVYFNRAESFRLNVAAGTEGLAPTAPSLRSDQILLADVTLVFGQTAIVTADISTARRQWMFKTSSGSVAVGTGTAEEAFTALATALNDHLVDAVDAHDASAVSSVPAGNLAATTVQAALNELDAEKLALAGGTMTGPINMGSQNITNANNISGGGTVVVSGSITGASFAYTSAPNHTIAIPLAPLLKLGTTWVLDALLEWSTVSDTGSIVFNILPFLPDGAVFQEAYLVLEQTSSNASSADQMQVFLFRHQQNFTTFAATVTDLIGAPTYYGLGTGKKLITLNPANITINKALTTLSDTGLFIEVNSATVGASRVAAIRIVFTDASGPKNI